MIKEIILVSFIIVSIFNIHASESESLYFPETIPIFHVRKDINTGMAVTRGRLKLMNFDASNMIQLNTTKKVNLKTFNEIAQCSNPAPDLNGNRGSLTMLRMVNITKKSLEKACAYFETGCLPYIKCNDYINKSKFNEYNPNYESQIPLIRIKSNSIYYDWPWGNERNEKISGFISGHLYYSFMIIEMVLSFITNIGDSFFFIGREQPTLNWMTPLPLFSFAPHLGSGDLPFPWFETYRDEFIRHKEASDLNNHSDETYQKHHTPWNQRISKAAFHASFDGNNRQLIFDQAAMRPDLFDAKYNKANLFRAWNFGSDEEDGLPDKNTMTYDPNRNHPGFIQPLVQSYQNGNGYNPAQFKYIIVPPGSGTLSTSGRLAQLIAHSGAIVLLPDTGFSYHFSGRLQQWVHYVPLTYSMADAIEKIEWLQAHDVMAQQIARNAINFGKSYLRYEDYFCYAANSLYLLSEMQEDGGGTEHSSKSVLIKEF